jgi:response regulator RpfG family c-di-GMP phosphodiesterase/tRNA A-37 threonylcarbamoyl transferase component Bud32
MNTPIPHTVSPRTARHSPVSESLTYQPLAFLDRLFQLGLLLPPDQDAFLADRLERLGDYGSDERLGVALVQAELLTGYQLERVLEDRTHGLVLGSYRVLDELGRGGMGTVYLAEHRLMKRRVAVKVVAAEEDLHPSIRQRFYAEMRVLAELSHPNVVMALDAGEVPGCGREPPLVFMVLELVEGGDLERLVVRQGVCGVVQACNYVRQAACGLQAAHDRHLIHRDLKPSNLLLSHSGQVKLVDFGLARQFSSRLTDPRALLGSVEFMPPEQSHDPSSVGKQADVYGLGATLFWLLTGEGPYPHVAHTAHALRQLQQSPPRRLSDLRPNVPAALDDLVARMLARSPDDRPASPLAVMNALRPFLLDGPDLLVARGMRPSSDDVELPRALIVGQVSEARPLLEQAGCECGQTPDGQSALEVASRERFDLALLDHRLPDGDDVCRRLRERADNPNFKILVVSHAPGDDPPPAGADDVVRSQEPRRLLTKVRQALELKAAQDRAARLADQLLAVAHQLEESSRARQAALDEAHDALLFTVAKIAESRDGETPGHLERMKAYVRTLALEAAKSRPWEGLIEERFLRQLERCVPLHDVGKIGLPDEVLLKPASLSPAERTLVQTHPVLGDQILEALANEHGAGLDFLGLARSIVRHHHERWDGRGYPDGLLGEAIPPAARLVAVADVYDALRRMRLYKPAMSHQAAIGLMLHRSTGQFDPSLLMALERCHAQFERIYLEIEE